jgi:thioredoxin 1
MNFDNEVLNGKGKILVDFYTDSCMPCRRMIPVLNELSKDFNVKKVNADEEDGSILACEYGVSAVPTFMIFENGKPIHQLVGIQSKEKLASLLI